MNKKVFADLHIDGVSEEKKEILLARLEENILQKIFISIMDKLSEEEKRELDSISKKKDKVAFESFIKSKIPDYELFIKGVVLSVVEEIKAKLA